MKTELCSLFELHGADKCIKYRHSYSAHYDSILKDIKSECRNVLEIGIGTTNLMQRYLPAGMRYRPGASLRAWRDYFPNAMVYGADINTSVLFEEERIQCFYTNQSSEEDLNYTVSNIRNQSKNPNLRFDLILDDGSHELDHMILTMQVLGKYLTKNGIYIVEDIKSEYMTRLISDIPENLDLTVKYDGLDPWDNFIALKRK